MHDSFGFEQADNPYTLDSFGQKANMFKQHYFNQPPTVSTKKDDLPSQFLFFFFFFLVAGLTASTLLCGGEGILEAGQLYG